MPSTSLTSQPAVCQRSGTRVHEMDPNGRCRHCHKGLALIATE